MYKAHDQVQVGIPDLIICLKGHFITVELKRVGGQGSPMQQYNTRAIRRAGGAAIISDDFDAIMKFLELLNTLGFTNLFEKEVSKSGK